MEGRHSGRKGKLSNDEKMRQNERSLRKDSFLPVCNQKEPVKCNLEVVERLES